MFKGRFTTGFDNVRTWFYEGGNSYLLPGFVKPKIQVEKRLGGTYVQVVYPDKNRIAFTQNRIKSAGDIALTYKGKGEEVNQVAEYQCLSTCSQSVCRLRFFNSSL